MPKEVTGLSTIKEEEPSNVFFSILRNGESAQPGDIVKDIEMASSSVTHNLNKLITVKILNSRVKEGRKMFYSVNWANFKKLVVKKYTSEENARLIHLINCEGLKKSKKPTKEEVMSILNDLNKSDKFDQYLKEYFTELAKNELITPDNIDDALDSLEENNMYKWKEISKKIGELTELHKIFIKWGKLLSRHTEVTDAAYWNAMKSLEKN